MKNKIILLVISIIILNGCTVEYNLDLDKNVLTETTTILTDVTTSETYENELLIDIFDTKNKYYEPTYINPENYDEYVGGYQKNVDYYKIEDYKKDNFKGLKISNNFDFNNYQRSRIINYCFDKLSMQKSDNYVLLRTNDNCKLFDSYPLLEKLTINIKTDLEVIVSNADKVVDNVYTWNINQNNYKNKSVHLTYSLGKSPDEEIKKPIEEKNEPKEEKNNFNILIILACYTILGLVLIIIIKKSKK